VAVALQRRQASARWIGVRARGASAHDGGARQPGNMIGAPRRVAVVDQRLSLLGPNARPKLPALTYSPSQRPRLARWRRCAAIAAEGGWKMAVPTPPITTSPNSTT
jgi:hypothetical protein